MHKSFIVAEHEFVQNSQQKGGNLGALKTKRLGRDLKDPFKVFFHRLLPTISVNVCKCYVHRFTANGSHPFRFCVGQVRGP